MPIKSAIDPARECLLGKFERAHDHAGSIHAATTIAALIDARKRCAGVRV
jgi:hypothetical protein